MRDNTYSVESLVSRLKREPLNSIPPSELLKPRKFAYSIAKQLKIRRAQLRRIYGELKAIFEDVKKRGSFDDESLTKLYMLYPILEYQRSRNLVGSDFVKLITALLENVEQFSEQENIDMVDKFLTALVAYARDK